LYALGIASVHALGARPSAVHALGAQPSSVHVLGIASAPSASAARPSAAWHILRRGAPVRHRARVWLDAQLSLEEGDLVEYRLPNVETTGADGKRLGIGCVHDGRIHPICKWTRECDEFLFDEDADSLDLAEAERALDMSHVWPSNRLVGGGLGPGNPHGEDSEECWSLAAVELSEDTLIVVRPEREVWW